MAGLVEVFEKKRQNSAAILKFAARQCFFKFFAQITTILNKSTILYF
jgi:hypothetical protein